MAKETRSGNCHILQDAERPRLLDASDFDIEHWRDRPGFEALGGGRGGSCVIEIDGQRAILRKYLRGGLARRLLEDQYLWLGKRLTRPWREWEVLRRARAAGLPVARPIGACACRFRLYYRAALITAYLEDTETLTERLRREKLERHGWRQLGSLIRRMQVELIRHTDLNADNILIDSSNRFYLVDFDKARIMSRIDDWQWRPLYRLQRSLLKQDGKRSLFYGEDDWQALMDGYQS